MTRSVVPYALEGGKERNIHACSTLTGSTPYYLGVLQSKKNIHPLFLVVNVIAIPFQISFSRPDDLVVTQSCHKTQTRSSPPCSLGPLRYAEVCFPTSKRLVLHLKAKVSVQYYSRDKKNDWKSWL